MNKIKPKYFRGSWTSRRKKHISKDCNWPLIENERDISVGVKGGSIGINLDLRHVRNNLQSRYKAHVLWWNDSLWNFNDEKSKIYDLGGIF